MAKGWNSVKPTETNYSANNDRIREFIWREYDKIPELFGPEEKGGNLWIFCPFHDREHIHLANKVSMKINMTDDNYPIGHGYCFSCGKGGKETGPCSWNEIAAELGVKPLKVSEMYRDTVNDVTDADREALGLAPAKRKINMDRDIEERSAPSNEKDEIMIASIPWKAEENWRTIKGKLLVELGCRKWVNDKTLDIQLYLPVYMKKQYVGGIKALLEKQEGLLSYVNTKGTWSSKALFPYDYVKRKFVRPRKKAGEKIIVFLVEGPRDALWLIQHGIPALAFLGSSTKFSEYAGELVMDLNPDLIVLAFDTDAPGIKATKKAKKFFSGRVDMVKLDMQGKKDPAQLKRKYLNEIKETLGL